MRKIFMLYFFVQLSLQAQSKHIFRDSSSESSYNSEKHLTGTLNDQTTYTESFLQTDRLPVEGRNYTLFDSKITKILPYEEIFYSTEKNLTKYAEREDIKYIWDVSSLLNVSKIHTDAAKWFLNRYKFHLQTTIDKDSCIEEAVKCIDETMVKITADYDVKEFVEELTPNEPERDLLVDFITSQQDNITSLRLRHRSNVRIHHDNFTAYLDLVAYLLKSIQSGIVKRNYAKSPQKVVVPVHVMVLPPAAQSDINAETKLLDSTPSPRKYMESYNEDKSAVNKQANVNTNTKEGENQNSTFVNPIKFRKPSESSHKMPYNDEYYGIKMQNTCDPKNKGPRPLTFTEFSTIVLKTRNIAPNQATKADIRRLHKEFALFKLYEEYKKADELIIEKENSKGKALPTRKETAQKRIEECEETQRKLKAMIKVEYLPEEFQERYRKQQIASQNNSSSTKSYINHNVNINSKNLRAISEERSADTLNTKKSQSYENGEESSVNTYNSKKHININKQSYKTSEASSEDAYNTKDRAIINKILHMGREENSLSTENSRKHALNSNQSNETSEESSNATDNTEDRAIINKILHMGLEESSLDTKNSRDHASISSQFSETSEESSYDSHEQTNVNSVHSQRQTNYKKMNSIASNHHKTPSMSKDSHRPLASIPKNSSFREHSLQNMREQTRVASDYRVESNHVNSEKINVESAEKRTWDYNKSVLEGVNRPNRYSNDGHEKKNKKSSTVYNREKKETR